MAGYSRNEERRQAIGECTMTETQAARSDGVVLTLQERKKERRNFSTPPSKSVSRYRGCVIKWKAWAHSRVSDLGLDRAKG